MPSTQSLKSRKTKKIIAYVIFVVITFSTSLLFLPHELFLLSTIVVLLMLRAVEKELSGITSKPKQVLDIQPVVKESVQKFQHPTMSKVIS